MAVVTVLLSFTLFFSLAAFVFAALAYRRGLSDEAGEAQLSVELAASAEKTRLEIEALGQHLRESLGEQMRLGAQHQSDRVVGLQTTLDARLQGLAVQASDEATNRLRADVAARRELSTTLGDSLQRMEKRVGALEKDLASGLDALRTANSAELEKMRINNEAQLEKMRATVDEKLQGTLERRLGESFKLVSDRLEQVQRGLGEMQTLATDVGGLKQVLSNVKSRGTWGEVLLGRQLEDSMTPTQYVENAEIKPGSGERVEFAIRLPGRDSEAPIFLPLDSKFPQEPYERLLDAQDEGDAQKVAACRRDLEKALRMQAQTISRKYIHPPFSTDFAVMYLPTEGLFAEAVRLPGFAADLQQSHRIMLTGPTTLMSLLGSLQMGFKTLAIEKRSSEVWKVLASAKVEFNKYGQVWEKLGRQLKTAQNTVEEAGRRTRAVERKLGDVEAWGEEPQAAQEPELTLSESVPPESFA